MRDTMSCRCSRFRRCRAPEGVIKELEDELREWTSARRALATSKSYTIGPRSLTRVDLREIRAAIKDIEEEMHNWCRYGSRSGPRGGRIFTGIPRS